MDEIILRDQNHVTVLAGVTDDIDQDIRMFRVDPITKRLLIKAVISGGGTIGGTIDQNQVAFGTPGVPDSISGTNNATLDANGNAYFGGSMQITPVNFSPQLLLGAQGVIQKSNFTALDAFGGMEAFWDLNLGNGGFNGVYDPSYGQVRFALGNEGGTGNPAYFQVALALPSNDWASNYQNAFQVYLDIGNQSWTQVGGNLIVNGSASFASGNATIFSNGDINSVGQIFTTDGTGNSSALNPNGVIYGTDSVEINNGSFDANFGQITNTNSIYLGNNSGSGTLYIGQSASTTGLSYYWDTDSGVLIASAVQGGDSNYVGRICNGSEGAADPGEFLIADPTLATKYVAFGYGTAVGRATLYNYGSGMGLYIYNAGGFAIGTSPDAPASNAFYFDSSNVLFLNGGAATIYVDGSVSFDNGAITSDGSGFLNSSSFQTGTANVDTAIAITSMTSPTYFFPGGDSFYEASPGVIGISGGLSLFGFQFNMNDGSGSGGGDLGLDGGDITGALIHISDASGDATIPGNITTGAILESSFGFVSADVTQRQLIANDGSTIVLDWSQPSNIYSPDIAGTFSATGTATTTFTVTIGRTMANTTYHAFTEALNLLSAPVHYVTNKTTTTFDVVYLTGLTGAVSFDWEIVP